MSGLSRRDLLRGTILLGLSASGTLLWRSGHAEDQLPGPLLHPLLLIDPVQGLRLRIARSEMGQGVASGLAQLLAWELDLPWAQLRIEHADIPAAIKRQGTSASDSLHSQFLVYRQAGALLRQALLEAAGRHWALPPAALRCADGAVHGPAGALDYRQLWAQLREPQIAAPPLRPGLPPLGAVLPRLDMAEKLRGRAVYGVDAAAAHSQALAFWIPPHGYSVVRVQRAPAGVRLLAGPTAVAVLAADTWSAWQARDALRVQLRRSDPAPNDNAALQRAFAARWRRPLFEQQRAGADWPAPDPARSISLQFQMPFLAHATLEPPAAVWRGASAEAWLATQSPAGARRSLQRLLGGEAEDYGLRKCWLGGGFGRKQYHDALERLILAWREAGRPAQDWHALYSRADEFASDPVRPASEHRLFAQLAPDGTIAAWRHQAVAAAVLPWYGSDQQLPPDQDYLSHAGLAMQAYRVAALHTESGGVRTAIPCGIWRGIGHVANCLVQEQGIDALAERAGADPARFRLGLLQAPRMRRVLEAVLAAGDWQWPPRPGRAQGLAVFQEQDEERGAPYGVFVAHLVSLARGPQGWGIERVDVAVDCGLVVAPDQVRAQFEGGVAWALSGMLAELRYVDGRPQARNFDAYPLLRHSEMPAVHVHLRPGAEHPSGAGEKGVPSLAPALLNAWAAAGGGRVTRLPWAQLPALLRGRAAPSQAQRGNS
ncbi:molybdopterin-dependent oxidoreductase [Paucibacter sediminis]|uniref:Molybdopterin-dependent oxidoreductase n=1 Tax=Paucibacter sediminis TaxID=3019553 RepID=A0AA95SXB4_9BURK|nr:molybdopterin cofactor-binding domain-containing protein [Paucibacter sp. S2-9]WIT12724.1 molybdopterin-dependent oxidoreductase [Paucibacter sp. S2-9]